MFDCSLWLRYEIERVEFGRVYRAAAKVITIPDESSEGFSVVKEGMTEENTIEYYRSLVEDIISECDLMERMKGDSHIVSYEDHSVEEREDGKQWTIYIRMELLTPLISFITDENNFLEKNQIIRIGMDICRGLETCQKFNIVHRDIKLENIFVSDTGHYKLGDFGISKIIEESDLAVSQKGTKLYMAPEIFRGEKYDATVDIYSLGLVLYRLLNRNRAPFLPAYPHAIRLQDKEQALQRRLAGELLPDPCNADEELSSIIKTACNFHPAKRYQTPREMRKALEMLFEEKESICPIDSSGEFENTSKTLYVQNAVGSYSFEHTDDVSKHHRKKITPFAGVFAGLVLIVGSGYYLSDNLTTDARAEIVFGKAIRGESDLETMCAGFVSKGIAMVDTELEENWIIVPDVGEYLESEAVEMLMDAGYQREQIMILYEYSDEVQFGNVMEQSVQDSRQVRKNTEIEIVISLGSKPEFTVSKSSDTDESNCTWIELD